MRHDSHEMVSLCLSVDPDQMASSRASWLIWINSVYKKYKKVRVQQDKG